LVQLVGLRGQVIGVDIDSQMIEIANKKAKEVFVSASTDA
jgi:ubiquinone/menaquinone biosynthesis C-methylase UbiE